MKDIFITGTDTGIGKTYSGVALMKALQHAGLRVAGMKPVASGAEWQHGRWVNEDAIQLQEASDGNPPYDIVNPYCFPLPVSPNFAAEQEQRPIELSWIQQAYDELKKNIDIVVVEGVGGWRVPFADHLQSADLVKQLDLDLVLVVGMTLGCINHALLTRDAIATDGITLKAWIANCLDDDYLMSNRTLEYLDYNLPCKRIGKLPYAAKQHEYPSINASLFLA